MYLERTWRILPVALVLAGLTLVPSAIADEKKAPEEKKEKPEFPPFDKTMKDFKEVPTSETPFFSLYHNKKKDALRAVIPASLIGKQFLIASVLPLNKVKPIGFTPMVAVNISVGELK